MKPLFLMFLIQACGMLALAGCTFPMEMPAALALLSIASSDDDEEEEEEDTGIVDQCIRAIRFDKCLDGVPHFERDDMLEECDDLAKDQARRSAAGVKPECRDR